MELCLALVASVINKCFLCSRVEIIHYLEGGYYVLSVLKWIGCLLFNIRG